LEPVYALLLGIVQGLTEFLPVSSSGHLVLFQHLFGLTEPEIFFDICLHIGTLLAIVMVFRRELGHILLTLFHSPGLLKRTGGAGNLFDQNEDIRLVTLILLGTIPTGIIGLLLKPLAEDLFSNVWIVGVMLLITGGLLWLTRRVPEQGRPLRKMRPKDALIIGLVQGMAIMPGLSRSGSTICIALLMGVDRETAGRYSFLLSIPAILGALVLGLDFSVIGHSSASTGVILLGTIVAALVGYAALIVLLRMIKKGRLSVFAPYCWGIGVVALLLTWS
jgi:undecaprenyl-diphosphatase